jgi:hypothetical protein
MKTTKLRAKTKQKQIQKSNTNNKTRTKTKADETKQKQANTLRYLLQGLIIEAQSLSISVVFGGLSDFLSFHVV